MGLFNADFPWETEVELDEDVRPCPPRPQAVKVDVFCLVFADDVPDPVLFLVRQPGIDQVGVRPLRQVECGLHDDDRHCDCKQRVKERKPGNPDEDQPDKYTKRGIDIRPEVPGIRFKGNGLGLVCDLHQPSRYKPVDNRRHSHHEDPKHEKLALHLVNPVAGQLLQGFADDQDCCCKDEECLDKSGNDLEFSVSEGMDIIRWLGGFPDGKKRDDCRYQVHR